MRNSVWLIWPRRRHRSRNQCSPTERCGASLDVQASNISVRGACPISATKTEAQCVGREIADSAYKIPPSHLQCQSCKLIAFVSCCTCCLFQRSRPSQRCLKAKLPPSSRMCEKDFRTRGRRVRVSASLSISVCGNMFMFEVQHSCVYGSCQG